MDNNNNIYKKCYYTCKECNKNGNNTMHNCLKCNDNYLYEIIKNNSTNCYEKCSYYHFFDLNNNYHCTINSSCPEEYSKLLLDKKECVMEMKNIINNIIINYEKNATVEKTKEEEIEYYDIILETLESGFTSDNYDTAHLDKGKEEIIETEKIKITFTTTQNQKNNKNENITKIDLGECETLLRKFYNLTNNESLYMKKIDVMQEGMKTPKIEYDVYSKLSGKNLIKLNLTICQSSKISLSIPVEIKDNLDKSNSSSDYCNDLCYAATESGADIILRDRKDECINNTVCQEECDFIEYNYTSQNAKCSCKVKQSSFSFADMNINKTKLFENIMNIKNFLNLNFLVCYNSLLSKEGILKNIGFYIISVILIFNAIFIIIFYKKEFDLLKNKINDIIYAIKNINLIKNNKKNKNSEEEKSKKNKENNIENKIRLDNIINNNNDKIFDRKKRNINKKRKNMRKNEKESTFIKIEPNTIIKDNSNIINNNLTDNNKKIRGKKLTTNIITNSNSDDKKIEKVKKIMEYSYNEIDILSYDLALQYDNRTYLQYYISLLRTRHILIFSFCYNDDYNSKIIKIDLFFIGFSIYYTVNALFFNDATMHNIYENKGSFDIEYQLPKIIYSSLISLALNMLLKKLSLSNDEIIKFKHNKKSKDVEERGQNLINKINFRFLLYFIISFIFLLFFWYYISMFGAIYKNTQQHLLKDTLMSYGLSLIYPFVIYLLPGLFRIPSLSDPKKQRKYLYSFSKILQIF